MQDCSRAPLQPSNELALSVFALLDVAADKSGGGGQLWRNFKKKVLRGAEADVTFVMPNDIEIRDTYMIGGRKPTPAVPLSQAPLLIATVLEKAALDALRSAELKLGEALVARGLTQAAADAAIERAVRLADPALPGDVELVRQVTSLFGAQVDGVRFARVPRRNGDGTVLVFVAIDLVMAAKRCEYDTASKNVFRIFKDYYGVELETTEAVKFRSSPELYRIRLPGSHGPQTLALDAQGAGELLCLIPGSEVSAQLRRRAVDTLLRVEGGDESLIDRIKANRKFQEYLQAHDPEHPLRSVGEHAERRQAEEAVPEEQRRAEMELSLAHRRRLLELELDERRAELEAKRRRLQLENDAVEAQQRAEAQRRNDEIHEAFRRDRAATINVNMAALQALHPDRPPLSPRSLRMVEDELRTAVLGRERPDAELGRPLYCSRFLQEELQLKEEYARERAKVFGRDVLAEVRAMFPQYDTEARTNRSVDGRDREAHLYFEAHLPAFRAALPKYLARAHPVADKELTRAGLQARRAAAQPSVRDIFQARE